MAESNITIKISGAIEFIDQVSPILAAWPEGKKDKFAQHWKDLEKSGAEIADTRFRDGVLYCDISDDFRRALADFGVNLGAAI